MSKPKICLDAGHYGNYNQSPVVPGYYEAQMTWKLHLLLKKELEAYGIEVIQTRSNQAKDMGLTARGKASKGCDLFLSIHSNAASTESVDYPLVIVMQNGKGDALGNKIAECIEAVMGTKQDGRIYKKRGTYGGEWYSVLAGADAVGTMGMIIEHSFHTNTAATKWLLVDANLEKLAKAEAKVIAEWFGVKKQETPEQWYRIRKEWKDANSQVGAYKNVELAKQNCPEGYAVFDWNGVCVYDRFAKKEEECIVNIKMLSKGSKGASVKALQTLLIGYGYSCGKWGADGDFGAGTDSAVKAYQKANGLGVDGIVGPATWGKLLGVS